MLAALFLAPNLIRKKHWYHWLTSFGAKADRFFEKSMMLCERLSRFNTVTMLSKVDVHETRDARESRSANENWRRPLPAYIAPSTRRSTRSPATVNVPADHISINTRRTARKYTMRYRGDSGPWTRCISTSPPLVFLYAIFLSALPVKSNSTINAKTFF